MRQVVFITLFLGLVAGWQTVELTVPDGTPRVDLFLDGKLVAIMRSPPWRRAVDFGPSPMPHRLEARTYDASGAVTGTATQKINVASPLSDLKIVVEERVAKLIWADIDAPAPEKIEARIDGAPVAVKGLSIPLPRFEDERIHLLEVSMKSASQEVESQLVFGGLFEDVASAELTAVPVQVRDKVRADQLKCAARGQDVRCAGIDDLPGQVIVVRHPSANDAAARLDLTGVRAGWNALGTLTQGTLEGEDRICFLWPLGRAGQGRMAAMLFYPSRCYVRTDLRVLLARLSSPHEAKELRFADAVAVAGLQVAQSQRPRAVVLVIGKNHQDASRIQPAGAREYLARLGVPLYVWSIEPNKLSDNAKEWGDAVDISSIAKLRSAASALRRDLSAQRILWVEGDHLPEEVTVTGGGVEALAKRVPRSLGSSVPR